MTTTSLNTSANDVERPLFDLSSLVAGIRWRRRLFASLALIGLLLGVAAATILPTRSTATTSVYVIHQDESSGDVQSLMKTDLALLQTTTIASGAIDRLQNGMTAERFLATYSGSIVANNILEITARGGNDAEALARVQAVADAFIAERIKQSVDAAAATTGAYLEQRAKVQKDLDDLNAQISTASSGADLQSLYDRRGTLASQIASLTQQAETANIGSPQVAAGTKILDAPRIASHGFLLGLVLYGSVGFGAGLALGLLLAAIATIIRDRPVLRRDLVEHLGASVVAQVAAPLRGPRKLIRRSSAEKERTRVAATLARLVRGSAEPVSVLEIGCPRAAAALVKDLAAELSGDQALMIIDDLPGDDVQRALAGNTDVELVAGADFPPGSPDTRVPRPRQLGIASLGPGTPWTDLRRLGAEALVVVRAGRVESTWLHTVARQLADAGIAVVGLVVVHPDPRDKTDGTVWDALHTAIRGRLAAAGKTATLADDAVTASASAATMRMVPIRPEYANGHPARKNGQVGSVNGRADNGVPNEVIPFEAHVIQIDSPTVLIPVYGAKRTVEAGVNGTTSVGTVATLTNGASMEPPHAGPSGESEPPVGHAAPAAATATKDPTSGAVAEVSTSAPVEEKKAVFASRPSPRPRPRPRPAAAVPDELPSDVKPGAAPAASDKEGEAT